MENEYNKQERNRLLKEAREHALMYGLNCLAVPELHKFMRSQGDNVTTLKKKGLIFIVRYFFVKTKEGDIHLISDEFRGD